MCVLCGFDGLALATTTTTKAKQMQVSKLIGASEEKNTYISLIKDALKRVVFFPAHSHTNTNILSMEINWDDFSIVFVRLLTSHRKAMPLI